MLSLHLSCSDHHVQEGWRVAAPYAIGVSTANKAYLLAPTALAGANLSEYSAAPAAARLVDDIWMNGHLAARGVRRYVVPLAGFSPDSEGMGVGGGGPCAHALLATGGAKKAACWCWRGVTVSACAAVACEEVRLTLGASDGGCCCRLCPSQLARRALRPWSRRWLPQRSAVRRQTMPC